MQSKKLSHPQSGEHNDLCKIKELFDEMLCVLKQADSNTSGLFLNADAGFDSHEFRMCCSEYNIEVNIKANPRNKQSDDEYKYFDEKLYEMRTKIEHANTRMDGFQALLIRFETKAINWLSLQWLAFIVIFCRKLKI